MEQKQITPEVLATRVLSNPEKQERSSLGQPSDPVGHTRQRRSGDRTSRIFRANASIAKGF